MTWAPEITVIVQEPLASPLLPIVDAIADILPSASSFTDPFYWDSENAWGGGARALYSPTTFHMARDGVTIDKSDVGPVATGFAAHAKLTVASSTLTYLWYLDLSDAAADARMKAVSDVGDIPAGNPDIVVIGTSRGAIFNPRGGFDVRPVSRDGLAHPKGPIVVQSDGLVWLPPFDCRNGLYALNKDGGSLNDSGITTLFKESVQLPVDDASLLLPTWLVKNLRTGLTETKVQATRPQQPLYAVILCRHGDQYSSDYNLIGEAIPGGTSPNLAVWPKGDFTKASLMIGGGIEGGALEIVNLADLDDKAQPMIDAGYTTGIRNTNANPIVDAHSKIYFGNEVLTANPSHWVTCMILLHSDAGVGVVEGGEDPGPMGNPRAQLIGADRNSVVIRDPDIDPEDPSSVLFGGGLILKPWIVYNDRCAWYAGIVQIPYDLPAPVEVYGIAPGTFALDTNSIKFTIADAKFTVSPTPTWINREDFGGASRALLAARLTGLPTDLQPLLMAPDVYLIGGRKMPFYPNNLLPIRTRGFDPTWVLERVYAEGVPGDGLRPQPSSQADRRSLILDPDEIGNSSLRLVMFAETHGNNAYYQHTPIAAHTTPPLALSGQTTTILPVGDSLWGIAGGLHQARRVLRQYGVTGPLFVGSTASNERLTDQVTPVTSGTDSTVMGELRPGLAAADFSGEGIDPSKVLLPVAVGDEATYMALSDSAKLAYCSFLRAVTTGDDSFTKSHAFKQSGDGTVAALIYADEVTAGHSPDPDEYFTWDIRRWHDVTGLAYPAILKIGAGTNEIQAWYDSDTTLNPIDRIRRAYEIMIYNTRLYSPTTIIQISLPEISTTKRALESVSLVDPATGADVGYAEWRRMTNALVKAWNDAHDGDDAYVQVIPVYASVDPYNKRYAQPADSDLGGEVDDDTGTYGGRSHSVEVVHDYPGASRDQVGDVEAAAIAYAMVGPQPEAPLALYTGDDGDGIETDTFDDFITAFLGSDQAAFQGFVFKDDGGSPALVSFDDYMLFDLANPGRIGGMHLVDDGLGGISLRGKDDFEIANFAPDAVKMAGLTFAASRGGLEIVSRDDYIVADLAQLAASSGSTTVTHPIADFLPIFGGTLAGIDGEEYSVYLAGLLQDRALVPLAFGEIAGEQWARAHGQQITVRPDKLAGKASINIYPYDYDGIEHPRRDIVVASAPLNPGSPPTIVRSCFGDSIEQYQAASIEKKVLADKGYTATYVGTLTCDDYVAADGTTVIMAGQKGEGKPGHEIGDFTYDLTTTVSPMATGSSGAPSPYATWELWYAAQATSTRRLYNTLLKPDPGDGSIDAGDIQNGYYLDFPFYYSRHGLTTPTIISYGYGYNTLKYIDPATIYDYFYAQDSLVWRRIRAGYPTIPLLRTLYVASEDLLEDGYWETRYVPAIKGMLAAAADCAGVKPIVVSTWAMASPYSGFDRTPPAVTPDPVTGAYLWTPTDAVHPTGATRYEIFRARAAAVACAASGLI